MKRRLLLIGGGGHCKSILDSLYNIGDYQEIGIIDKPDNIGNKVLDTTIIGSDDDLEDLYNSGFTEAFVSVGTIDDFHFKLKIIKKLEKISFSFPNIIDPSATVSEYCKLTKGVFIGKSAIVNANATIGNFAIINSRAICEHDVSVGDCSHIAPGAIILGNVGIGKKTHIGAGSVIKQGLTIGSETLIGMGSNVVNNIGSHTIAYGNPCKVVGSL
ncbi:NeuD/PglB/VioB family sugar acetyltransferase [Amphibacillus sediminis]|uniref:NeuD/PglB/VioB family sugar acetyltransferase n=1 Tax=Amphibacillus sediminis TaxID=360185 RepID=UPI00082C4099|nr:NeuD/PglB/VioB family sugar acetyltransferase [Amphibacillus sediminis]